MADTVFIILFSLAFTIWEIKTGTSIALPQEIIFSDFFPQLHYKNSKPIHSFSFLKS